MITEKMGGVETIDLSGYLNGGWSVKDYGYCSAYKSKSTVSLHLGSVYDNTADEHPIMTLPTGIRPKQTIRIPIIDEFSSSAVVCAWIQPNGNVTVRNVGGTVTYTTTHPYSIYASYIT